MKSLVIGDVFSGSSSKSYLKNHGIGYKLDVGNWGPKYGNAPFVKLWCPKDGAYVLLDEKDENGQPKKFWVGDEWIVYCSNAEWLANPANWDRKEALVCTGISKVREFSVEDKKASTKDHKVWKLGKRLQIVAELVPLTYATEHGLLNAKTKAI